VRKLSQAHVHGARNALNGKETALKYQVSALCHGSSALPGKKSNAFLIHHLVLNSEPPFSRNVIGILILRIAGDDSSAGLQSALVEHLNSQLRNETTDTPIEVHATTKFVNEKLGLAKAPHEAYNNFKL
jgi:hypothetical protein